MRLVHVLAAHTAVVLAIGVVVALDQPGNAEPQRIAAQSVQDARPVSHALGAADPVVRPAVAKAPVRPAVKLAAKPVVKRVVKPVVVKKAVVPQAAAPAGTARQRLDLATSRLPGYRPGGSRWVLRSSSRWGMADWYENTAYISTSVPSDRIYDVVAHEWSHLVSVRTYGGDVDAAVKAMNAWFGGSGFTGAERAADCMARALGATWTHYTACTDAHSRAGARALLAGQRL